MYKNKYLKYKKKYLNLMSQKGGDGICDQNNRNVPYFFHVIVNYK